MAWRTFHHAYVDRLWRYLLVVAGGREDTAREALQGALVRAVRHIKVFEDETVFWSWLTVLARSALATMPGRAAVISRFSAASRISPWWNAMG